MYYKKIGSLLLLGLAAAAWPLAAGPPVQLVSRVPFVAGDPLNGDSRPGLATPDGRWLAVETVGNNMVEGLTDINDQLDIVLFDLEGGERHLVSARANEPLRSGRGNSHTVDISDDGRYLLYDSSSGDVVDPVVLGNLRQVYLYDRLTGGSKLISRSINDPLQGSAVGGGAVAFSADGRFAYFASRSADLVASYVGTGMQLYLFDRDLDTIRLVTGAGGSASNGSDGDAGVVTASDDGRYLLFESFAADLVTGITDTANTRDVFLWDRVAGTTLLVSRSAASATTAVGGNAWKISPNGRWAIFHSDAGQLVAGFVDGNGLALDAYLFDRDGLTNVLISGALGSPTQGANGGTNPIDVTDDGDKILLFSGATNLRAPLSDTNEAADVYLKSRAAGTVQLVSHRSDSLTATANADSIPRRLSADGRFAFFITRGEDLVSGVTDGNFELDLYRFDALDGSLALASREGSSLVAAGTSDPHFRQLPMRADGGLVFFERTSNDLPAGRPSVATAYLAATSTAFPAGTADFAGVATGGFEPAFKPAISSDGHFVAFTQFSQACLFDSGEEKLTLLSTAAGQPGVPANNPSFAGPMSQDGRFVTIDSRATNLVAGLTDTNSAFDVFRLDRQTGAVTLVSHRANDQIATAGLGAGSAWIRGDGLQLVLVSESADLIPAIGGNLTVNVFHYDVAGRSASLVTHAAGQPTVRGNADSFFKAASADGRWILAMSNASNLLTGFVDNNDIGPTLLPDYFLFDRLAGEPLLVNRKAGSPTQTTAGSIAWVDLSGDGRFVFYNSRANDLVAGQVASANTKGFVFDRNSGTAALVAALPGQPASPCAGDTEIADASADGRFVLFHSTCANLAPGDANTARDVFVLDRNTQQIQLISRDANGQSLNVIATAGKIADDGGRVVFQHAVPGSVDQLVRSPRIGGTPEILATSFVDGTAVGSNFQILGTPSLGTVGFQNALPRLVRYDGNGAPDYFLVGAQNLFADGFERGDTSAWSLTTP